MKVKIKEVMLHIGIFASVLAILYLFLCLTSAIPNDIIKDNMSKSAKHLLQLEQFPFTNGDNVNSIQDNYADAILLNVAYRMGEDNAFVSALDTKYYAGGKDGEAYGLYATIHKDAEPNTDYTRYWHGCAAFVRLYHIFASVRSMRIAGLAVFALLLALTLFYLAKLKKYKIAACLLISMLCVQVWNIGLSLEYQTPFIVCFLVAPLYIFFERKNERMLSYLSVACGVLIAFFDFLTAETVSILIPLMLVASIRMEEGRSNGLKKDLWFYGKNIFAWLASYAMTFVAKWSLASLVTGQNKFIPALSSVDERLSGNTIYYGSNWLSKAVNAIFGNITAIMGGNSRADVPMSIAVILIAVFAVASLVYLVNKPQIKGKGILLIMSAAVIVRFMVLNNHSYIHAFFTYRALSSIIFAVLCTIMLQISFGKNKQLR